MRHALIVFGFFLAGCGGDLLYVEAEVTSLCQSTTVPAPAATGSPLAAQSSLTLTLPAELASALAELEGSLTLRSVDLRAVGGGDLGFVDRAHLTLLAPKGKGLTDVELTGYRRTLERPASAHLEGAPYELVQYLDGPSLRALVRFEGRAPQTQVFIETQACADASVRLNYAR